MLLVHLTPQLLKMKKKKRQERICSLYSWQDFSSFKLSAPESTNFLLDLWLSYGDLYLHPLQAVDEWANHKILENLKAIQYFIQYLNSSA